MVPAAARLRSAADFAAATRRGRRGSSPTLVVHLLVTDRPGSPRVGFVVSKKVGNSVIRHRVTRRLRPLVRSSLPALPDGADLVVRALPAAAQATSARLADHLDGALRGAARRAGIEFAASVLVPAALLSAGLGLLLPQVRAPEPASRRRSSPLAWLLIQPIRAYQRFITPYTPATCRYYPTCSAYAVGALRTHGAVKGVLLTTWRLLRCNPWSSGGIDHVPARGRWRGSTEIVATGDGVPGSSAERLRGANRSATDLDSNAQPDPARAPIAGSTAA